MQGAEWSPKKAGLETANIASQRTLLHATERLNERGVTLTSEEKQDEGQAGMWGSRKQEQVYLTFIPCCKCFSQFVAMCYQRYQHKLHNGMCYRRTHDECQRIGSCPLHSPIVCMLLPSSSKQALNQRKQIAWGNLNPYYQHTSGPKLRRILGPAVGTKIRKLITKIEECFF